MTENKIKNKIYDILNEITKHKISDIHMGEGQPVYVRNSTGKVVQLENVSIERDEIYGYMHDILPTNKVDVLLNGNEVDVSCKINGVYFRTNAYLDRNGIRLALRRISSDIPSMDDLDLPEHLKDYLLKDKGLILITGPTGSGKSTTMAAMINYINENRNTHIITLEDPIEFVFENNKSLITQREIGKNSPSWEIAIKNAMRQDPDVLMVGEMRDVETIASVLTLVETGHLVISTLHTVDAAQTITRIIDVFPPNKQDQIAIQLSLSLELVLSQRLLPLKQGKGRTAVRDILVNTKAIANNIRQRKIPQIISIMETGYRYGMKTMDQSMAEAVVKGLVDMDTVVPRVRNMETFNNLINSYKNAQRTFSPID